MKVELISYTPDAVNVLLFTKNTRLMDDDDAYEKIKNWTQEEKQGELDYMLITIRSSWEFIDYVFNIREVTRGFTHQFVRTRQGSYAQQSQRTVDMTGFDYYVPERIAKDQSALAVYEDGMDIINEHYQRLRTEFNIPAEDARGLLPTNIHTNIVAKFNLRTLSEMAKSRLSPRAQGEYQEVFKLMKKRVEEVHPWAEPFLTPTEWAAPSMSKPLNPK